MVSAGFFMVGLLIGPRCWHHHVLLSPNKSGASNRDNWALFGASFPFDFLAHVWVALNGERECIDLYLKVKTKQQRKVWPISMCHEKR